MTAGDPLVGQPTVIAVGPSGNFRGTLYQIISDPTQTGSLLPGTGYAYGHTVLDPAIANSAALVYTANTNPLESSDPTYLQSNWTRAISFGDVNDESSRVAETKQSPLNYGMLAELNVRPRTSYLAKLTNTNPEMAKE